MSEDKESRWKIDSDKFIKNKSKCIEKIMMKYNCVLL